nr:MAG TPA: hypothetical protein [Caudoviricetes sp.]
MMQMDLSEYLEAIEAKLLYNEEIQRKNGGDVVDG